MSEFIRRATEIVTSKINDILGATQYRQETNGRLDGIDQSIGEVRDAQSQTADEITSTRDVVDEMNGSMHNIKLLTVQTGNGLNRKIQELTSKIDNQRFHSEASERRMQENLEELTEQVQTLVERSESEGLLTRAWRGLFGSGSYGMQGQFAYAPVGAGQNGYEEPNTAKVGCMRNALNYILGGDKETPNHQSQFDAIEGYLKNVISYPSSNNQNNTSTPADRLLKEICGTCDEEYDTAREAIARGTVKSGKDFAKGFLGPFAIPTALRVEDPLKEERNALFAGATLSAGMIATKASEWMLTNHLTEWAAQNGYLSQLSDDIANDNGMMKLAMLGTALAVTNIGSAVYERIRKVNHPEELVTYKR